MTALLLVAGAGALGALSRYAIQTWVGEALGRSTTLGTLLVNVSGSFLLGLLIALADERGILSPNTRIAGAAGFLGAYTTFSTLMFETVDRWQAGEVLLAAGYLAASLCLGLLAAYVGLTLGRQL